MQIMQAHIAVKIVNRWRLIEDAQNIWIFGIVVCKVREEIGHFIPVKAKHFAASF